MKEFQHKWVVESKANQFISEFLRDVCFEIFLVNNLTGTELKVEVLKIIAEVVENEIKLIEKFMEKKNES